MAELENKKHEAFCQAYINNQETNYNGVKSYQLIYTDVKYDSACAESSRLLRNDKIKARIDELVNENRELNRHKAEQIEGEFWKMYNNTKYSEHTKSRALENISKLHGLFIDKKQIDATISGKVTIEISKDFITDE